MSGSDWGRHSKSCCKTPLGNVAVSTAWQTSRGPATSSTTDEWDVLCHIYQGQNKKWWENVIFTIHVLSRLTALLSWAASLGWTSAVTCCNIYRVPRTYSIHKIIRTSILLVPSLNLSFTWNVTRSNSRTILMVLFLINFLLFCLTWNNIMHMYLIPPSMRDI